MPKKGKGDVYKPQKGAFTLDEKKDLSPYTFKSNGTKIKNK